MRAEPFCIQPRCRGNRLEEWSARCERVGFCFGWQVFLAFLLVVIGVTASGQETGSITGLVISSWDASPLPNATITVRGTTLATQTDVDGRFAISGVPTGDHILRFSRSGFVASLATEVRVLPGQTTTVKGNLRPEFYEMEEYEVRAEEFTQQTEQILIERQNAVGMMDAVGSDTFKNLAVGDAAGALSKVTGATVADGKYAVVRGLADRYTFTTLNGMELPSADPDRKAFQLDLLPSSFMEKMDVNKTFTPDMSGGFAGGSIDIQTKSFPEDFVFEFRLGTAYNTQSSLRDDFASSDRSSTDWLGFDDGLRAMPSAAANSNPSGTQVLPNEVKHSFESSQFAPVAMDSPLDASLSLLFGDSEDIRGMKLGYLAGFNYKNEYRFYDGGLVRSYDQGGQVVQIDKSDTRGVIDYQWGALANLSLQMNERHELKFNFMYIQSAEDEARRLQGQDGDVTSVAAGTYTDQSILRWTERNLTYFQLAGGHDFPELNQVRLDWGASHSTTTQEDPDYRIFQFYADPQNDYYNPEISSATPSYPTRYWRDLQEDNDNVRGDLTIPLPSANSRDNALKTGAAYSLSERDFAQRGFSIRRQSSAHPFYHDGDPNEWMAEENLEYVNARNFPANLTYTGQQTINAGYLMTDWNVVEWLQFIGGMRYEETHISIDSFNLTQNRPNPSGSIRQNDLLPSVAAILRFNDKVDLRAAWSQTVVRPTFREIADVPIYDVTQNRTISGNPDLEISDSANYDLRLSWYPRPGEVLSASVFAKKIDGPIEQSVETLDNSNISYENFEQADVFGFEAEVRVRLDRVSDSLEAFSIGVNGAYIESEVPLTKDQKINRAFYGEHSSTRPLYSQPSYIVNGDLTWDHQATGTTVTLSGGVVGESLTLVGLAKPDEFIQPAPELNLYIRQRIGKHWDVRFTAKNLLNPDHEISQTWPEMGKTVLRSYTKGVTLGLSVGCEF